MNKYSAIFSESMFVRTLTLGFRLTVEIYSAMTRYFYQMFADVLSCPCR